LRDKRQKGSRNQKKESKNPTRYRKESFNDYPKDTKADSKKKIENTDSKSRKETDRHTRRYNTPLPTLLLLFNHL